MDMVLELLGQLAGVDCIALMKRADMKQMGVEPPGGISGQGFGAHALAKRCQQN